MVGRRVRTCYGALSALLFVLVLSRGASAQALRDGTDFSLDLTADDGPVCVTVPAAMRDPKACAMAVDVPTDDLTADGSVVIGVAQRRTGNEVVVVVITSAVASHPKVSDATVASSVTGMKSLMAHDKTAEVGHTPMEVSREGTPHFAITIASLIQGVPVETRSHSLFAADRTYGVSFVAMPRQHAANASWERTVIQSVRLARPATYEPTYVEGPSTGFRIADTIGRLIGGAIVILAIVMAIRYASRKPAAQGTPPAAGSAQEKASRRPEWWERE